MQKLLSRDQTGRLFHYRPQGNWNNLASFSYRCSRLVPDYDIVDLFQEKDWHVSYNLCQWNENAANDL